MNSQTSDAPTNSPASTMQPPALGSTTTTTTTSLKSSEEVFDILKKQLECEICTSIFHEPVALVPCLHTYCGACISTWLRTNPTCPHCRTVATETRNDFKAKELASFYLSGRPEEKRVESEIKDMDEKYRAGKKIRITTSRAAYDPYYEEYFDIEDEDDEDEDDDDEEPPRPEYWVACPWCLPPSTDSSPSNQTNRPAGFTCASPLPPAGTSTIEKRSLLERRSPDHTIPFEVLESHLICETCDLPFPKSMNKPPCVMCGNAEVHCNLMASLHIRLSLPNHVERGPVDEHWHPYAIKSLIGQREAEILNTYLVSSSTHKTLPTLFLEAKRSGAIQFHDSLDQLFQTKSGAAYEEASEEDPVPVVCKTCEKAVFREIFKEWWKQEKAAKNVPDERENCWYGVECRTWIHNITHRERLNHYCDPLPEDQRVPTRRHGRDGPDVGMANSYY